MFDENNIALLSLSIKGRKINTVQYNGASYEFKRHTLNHRTTVYKDGTKLCRVGPVSGYWEINYSHETIWVKYNYNFRDITIYKDKHELGKVSRKIESKKNIFGLALREELDPLIIAYVLSSRLVILKSLIL